MNEVVNECDNVFLSRPGCFDVFQMQSYRPSSPPLPPPLHFPLFEHGVLYLGEIQTIPKANSEENG